MAQVVKNLPANAGEARDSSSIPGSGRSPGGGNGTPLQYSCWDNLQAEEAGGLQSMGSRVGHYWSPDYVASKKWTLLVAFPWCDKLAWFIFKNVAAKQPSLNNPSCQLFFPEESSGFRALLKQWYRCFFLDITMVVEYTAEGLYACFLFYSDMQMTQPSWQKVKKN